MSEATKNVVMLKLTVPWEKRMEGAFEWKGEKNDILVNDCHRRGWKARCLPVEVGCRGFARQSSAEPTLHSASLERAGEGPSETTQRQQRKPLDGSG